MYRVDKKLRLHVDCCPSHILASVLWSVDLLCGTTWYARI